MPPGRTTAALPERSANRWTLRRGYLLAVLVLIGSLMLVTAYARSARERERSVAEAGNVAEAQRLHHKLFPLCRDMLSLSTNPIPLKAAMALLGRDTGEVRLPLTSLTDREVETLRQTLAAYGLVR